MFGNSTRDFLYSRNAVEMAVLLMEQGQLGEVYNMGSESTIEIYELARLIGMLMGHPKIQIIEDRQRKRPWEIWHLQSDNSKLWACIGNQSKELTSLNNALKMTIDYFRENGNKWDW